MRKPRKTTAKRTPRKSTTKTLTKRRPSARSILDPWNVPQAIIPKGKVYQWVPFALLGDPKPVSDQYERMVAAGWRSVPRRRHAKMFARWCKRGSWINIQGLALMERSVELNDTGLKANTDAAMQQANEGGAPFGLKTTEQGEWVRLHHPGSSEGRGYPMLPADQIVTRDYQRMASDAPDIDVVVLIKVTMTASQQDTASALKLTIDEYAQRYVDLHATERVPGVLIPWPGYDRGAYRLVNLTVSNPFPPKKD